MIGADQLVAAGVGPTQAATFAQPLSDACERFGINTPARLSAFIGQCMVEAGEFVHLEENLFYSSPDRLVAVFPSHFPNPAIAVQYTRNPAKLASRVYANRLGNGDEASGDGWAYRGRGLIQLTGRAEYADAGQALGQPYLEQPDLVAQPKHACLTAAWYFASHGLNTLADGGAIDAITRAVNGSAMLEAALRRQYTEGALVAFAA